MAERAQAWDDAYEARGATGVSWYEPSPRVSLEIISSLRLPVRAPLIDIGGGASGLAAELVARGHTDVSVLDLSEVALRAAQGLAGRGVTWLHEDVLAWRPPRRYALWHDRAVLHFFVEDDDCRRYLRALESAVRRGGFVVLGVFAPEGPARCSGLPVRRYGADDLVRLLGAGYSLRVERHATHVTPGGVSQPFTWVAFERVRG